MTQENKDLLLKYLCMALPYEVKILDEGWDYEWDDELSTVERVVGIDENFIYTKVIDTHNGEEYRDDKWPIDTFDAKPYLRSMSSMSDEEKEEFDSLWNEGFGEALDAQLNGQNDLSVKTLEITASYKSIQWLLKKHFDFVGLIPKGLAIEVTKDNNPYKD